MRRRRKRGNQAETDTYVSALAAATQHPSASSNLAEEQSVQSDAPFWLGYLQEATPEQETYNSDSDYNSDEERNRRFMQEQDETYDSSDFSNEEDEEWEQVEQFLGDLGNGYKGTNATEAELPEELGEKLKLLNSRQRDVRRTVRRLGRLQQASLKTLPDLDKARKRMALNSMAEDFRWLTFSWLGESPMSIVPRLLMLWVIGLPLLLMRLVVSLVLLYITLGMPAMLTVTATMGGSIPLQMYYRDVLKWAMHNDTLQEIWDAVASALAIALSLLVYAIRLLVEIHNGFCPFWALVAAVLYDVAVQLTVVWYAAPALQYIALWLLRLVVFLIEPMLDLLVTVFESFMFLVVETVSVIGSVAEGDLDGISAGANVRAKRAEAMGLSMAEYTQHCAQHPEDQMCWGDIPDVSSAASGVGDGIGAAAEGIGNVGKDAAGAMRSQGDMLLEVVAIVLTAILRVMQALLVAFAPMIYSFFRMVLPVLLKLFPFMFELLGALASILVSDAFKRILDFLIQAIPIIVEVIGTLLCSVGIYLGSALCYIVYALAVTLSFYVKYYLRPYFCGLGAFYGGCLESFVMSILDGNECYSCGQYNTACGCRKATYPGNGCGSDCVDANTNQIIPAPPPTANPPPTKPMNKSKNYGADASNPLQVMSVDPEVTQLTQTGYNSDAANIPQSGDPAFASVPEIQGVAGSSAPDDISIGTNPALVRRRTANATTPISSTLSPIPPPIPPPATLYVLSTSASDVHNSEVMFTSSPGFYADLVLVEVPTLNGTSFVPAIGSQARYSPYTTSTACLGNINSACTSEDVWAALAQPVLQTGAQGAGKHDMHAWEPALLAPASSTHFQSLASITPTAIESAYEAALNPWLKLQLNRGHRVSQLRLHWRASDLGLQAPESTQIQVRGVDGSNTLQFVDTRICLTNAATRRDIISLPLVSGQLASSVTITPLKSCAQSQGNSEFTAVYSLNYAELRAMSDDAQQSSTLKVPTHIPLSNPKLVHLSPQAALWDGCAQRSLARLVDGMVGASHTSPLLLHMQPTGNTSAVPSDSTVLMGASFELWPGRVSSAMKAESVSEATINFRGPQCPHPSDLLLCVHNPASSNPTYPSTAAAQAAAKCVSATELTTEPLRETRSELYRTYFKTTTDNLGGVSQEWLNSNNGFYGPDWAKTPLVRDCSHQFDTQGMGNTKGLVLWVLTAALSNSRATDWTTAQLELGLDPTRAASAQWTSTIQANLQGNGKEVNTAAVPQLAQCREVVSAAVTSLDKWSTYSSPFGSTSQKHHWLAIDEVTVRVIRPAADTLPGSEWSQGLGSPYASRRLQQLPEDETLDDKHMRRLLGEQPLSWEKVPDKVTVKELLSLHGNSRTSGASSVGHNQPFYDDLTQMPDPAREARFGCFTYTLNEPDGNVTRLRCDVVRPAALGAPVAAEETPINASTVQPQSTKTDIQQYAQELQQRLDMHTDLGYQRAILREQTIKQLAQSTQKQNKLEHTDTQGHSSSRRLFIFGGIGDSIKGWVMSVVEAYISGLETLICLAMGCPAYCHSSDGCDDSSLMDCFEAFGQYMLEGIFGCDSGDDILTCIMRPVRDLLKMLLRHILFIMDSIASGVASVTGLGDMIKLIACMSCSITSIVSGVLSDFAADFPVSLCSSIVDTGGEQCEAWGLGGDDFGGSVFGQVWPLIKLSFGLVQVLPAVVEVTVEVATVVFSGVIDIFPELMGDLFDVVMWFITSSELIGTVEILFEAFDPMLKESSASIDSKMRGAASAQAPATAPTNPKPVMSDCARPGESSTPCGSAYQQNGTARNASSQTAGPVTDTSDLGFALEGCGCQVQQPKCTGGVASDQCPFQKGDYAQRMAKQAEILRQIRANLTHSETASNSTNSCPTWPYCEGVTPRTIGKGPEAESSGQFKTTCVASKQCRMEFVGLEAFSYNEKSTLPFVGFSLRDAENEDGEIESQFYRRSEPTPNKGYGCFDDPNAAQYDSHFGVPDVSCARHRRRAAASTLSTLSNTQRRLARRLMGVDHYFDTADAGSKSTFAQQQAEFIKASRGLDTMLKAGNRSYAWFQARAIRAEVTALYQLGEDAYANVTSTVHKGGYVKQFMDTMDYTGRVLGHSRKLLFSGSEAAEKIGCGWLDVEDYAPNTYPCCKGLWCCIPPPFPDDFYIDKEWFTWKDSWQEDTLCPYLETYPDGWLFAMRAICKLVRDAADGVIGVWPYNAMIDTIWSLAFEFPNDEWPDTSKGMWTCIGLNIGIYVALALMIGIVIYRWIYFVSFYSAHFVILQPISRQGHNIKVLLKRSYVPVGTMRSRRRTEFNATLD